MASIQGLLAAHEARFPGAVSGGVPQQSAFSVFVDEFTAAQERRREREREQQALAVQERRLQQLRKLAPELGFEEQPTLNAKTGNIGVKFVRRNPLDVLQREITAGQVDMTPQAISQRGMKLGVDPTKLTDLINIAVQGPNVFDVRGEGFVSPELREPEGRPIARQQQDAPIVQQQQTPESAASEVQPIVERPSEQFKQEMRSGDFEFIPQIDRFGNVVGYKTQKIDVAEIESKEAAKKVIEARARQTLGTVRNLKERIKYFGPASAIPPLPMEFNKIRWKANYDRLRGQLVVDLMNDMRKGSAVGATGLGALSEKELDLLLNTSTELRADMSEEDAMEILNDLEAVTLKIIGNGDAQKDMTSTTPGVDDSQWKKVGSFNVRVKQ